MPWLGGTLININIYALNKKIYNHHAYNAYKYMLRYTWEQKIYI